MRRLFILVLLFCAGAPVYAQQQAADSLIKILGREKVDSNRVNLLWNIGLALSLSEPEKALSYANESYKLATQIQYEKGESRSLGIMAKILMAVGNYPAALEYNFKKLALEENGSNYYNQASVLMNIGAVYVYLEQYKETLAYYYRASAVITKHEIKELKYYNAINLGDVFDRLKNTDSAFKYFSESLVLAQEEKNTSNIGASFTGLGHSYSKMHEFELAKVSYTSALKNLNAVGNVDLACEAWLGLAEMYRDQRLEDSAIVAAKRSLQLAIKADFLPRQLNAVEFLAELYHAGNNNDSAYAYMAQQNVLSNKIFSKTSIRQSQLVSSNEKLRQIEAEAARLQAKQERSQQLQMLFIAIFIPLIFLVTLLLSKIRVREKIVKTLGVVSLLFFFEFITLLLHPLVANFTHHTPIYEIIIFVGIAALVIPLHHKIEHWLINSLLAANVKKEKELIALKVARFRRKAKEE